MTARQTPACQRSASEATSSNIAQLTATGVYDALNLFENRHNRFYGGLRFIGGVVQIGIEFSISTLGRFQDETSGTERGMPSVFAFNSTLGLDF